MSVTVLFASSNCCGGGGFRILLITCCHFIWICLGHVVYLHHILNIFIMTLQYISGFFDADGSITIGVVTIIIRQRYFFPKNKKEELKDQAEN